MTTDEIIAEFRTRLMRGEFGDRELLMDHDHDYLGMWSRLCERLSEWEARFGFDNLVVAEVRTALHRIADERPNAVAVFALRTTRYGRDDRD